MPKWRWAAVILLLLPVGVAYSQSSAQIEANKGVLKLSPTVALPSPCRQGQLWFDSTTTSPKSCNDGVNWVAIGGSLAPGTATTCTANSILYTDGAQALQCSPAAVVNGSVSTAGRSIVTIRDTWTSGQSMLNVIGTMPATLSASTYGVNVSVALDNDGQTQAAMRAESTGSGPSAFTAAIIGDSASASSLGAGVLGSASGANTTSYGVIGYATAGTNKFGGFFSLAYPGNPSGISALVADNQSVAADILQARDNATVVWSIVDGGYIQGTRGEVSLNANYTNATASFSSTALSVDVVSGRTYAFDLNLMFADSTAADGAQFDFNGGSAAATNFDVHCTAANNAGAALVITNAASTTLATAVQVALALTSQATLRCSGSFVPSGSGTFIVRAAQTAHSTGTLTVNRGSSMSVRDSRPL